MERSWPCNKRNSVLRPSETQDTFHEIPFVTRQIIPYQILSILCLRVGLGSAQGPRDDEFRGFVYAIRLRQPT